MIYDEEDLLRALQSHVKSNLNTQIAAINTEKGDFTIDQIPADDDHYVFAGELQELPNHAFVNFAIDGEIDVVTNSGDMASIPNFRIEVAFDNPMAPDTYFKALRYMRALYEAVLSFEPSTGEVDDLKIAKAVSIWLLS